MDIEIKSVEVVVSSKFEGNTDTSSRASDYAEVMQVPSPKVLHVCFDNEEEVFIHSLNQRLRSKEVAAKDDSSAPQRNTESNVE